MDLKCISCNVQFSVPELHREHYKSGWHRYNLKRRIAELPPLTKEQFEEIVITYLATIQEKEKPSLKCAPCNTHFSSENAISSHLKSKKHLNIEATANKKPTDTLDAPLPHQTIEAKIKDPNIEINENDSNEEWSDDGDWESCDEEDEERIIVDTNDCLFCDHQCDSTENNVKHMTKVHSFFIPDLEYVSDIDSLIGYLAGKIHVGHICLWCNGKGKGFKSMKSVRQHMIDMGHCKMLYEGDALLDYAEFYNYSEKSFDDDAVSNLLQESDFELVLPSGATVGHRSLALYYKQNLKPVSSDSESKVKKVLQYNNSLGYLGATGPAAIQKARDINVMQRIRCRYDLNLRIKSNKLQPHFRSQIMF